MCMCALPEPRDVCSCAFTHHFLVLVLASRCPLVSSISTLKMFAAHPRSFRLTLGLSESRHRPHLTPNRDDRQPWIAHKMPRPTPKLESPPLHVVRATRCPSPTAA